MSGLTHPATLTELAWLTAPAVRAQAVASGRELVAISRSDAWRVRVTERGEAAIIGRRREHLSDCEVFGLWCSPSRVPALIGDLLEVAREQGFGRLVGPFVPESGSRPYLDAGLRVIERVVVMRAETRQRARVVRGPDGLTIRVSTASDLDTLVRLDGECFDAFWHYDAQSLRRLAGTGRLVVAVSEGRVVGYTLSTLRSGDGSLGRLAVAPDSRRRGIARMLVADALAWLAAHGARHVVLSTQEDNTASRALYRDMGFDETGDALVACASAAFTGPAADERR